MLSHDTSGWHTLSPGMAPSPRTGKKPAGIVLSDFGNLLKEIRDNKNWKPGVVIRNVRDFSPALASFDRTRLNRLEEGLTPRPEALAIWALASVYGRDVRDFLSALKINFEKALGVEAPSPPLSLEEGPVHLDMLERNLIERFRSLPRATKNAMLRQLNLEEIALRHGGAAIAEVSFRGSKRR